MLSSDVRLRLEKNKLKSKSPNEEQAPKDGDEVVEEFQCCVINLQMKVKSTLKWWKLMKSPKRYTASEWSWGC